MSTLATVIERIERARTVTTVTHPFIAVLLLGLKCLPNEKLDPPTMVTDGKYLQYAPDYVNGLTDQELRHCVANVTMRLVFGCYLPMHIAHREPVKWDIACDIVINALLDKEKRPDGTSTVGQRPASAVWHPDLAEQGGSIEGVYALLPDNPPDSDKNGRHGVQPMEGDASEQAEHQAMMQIRVAQARDVANAAGKLSESMARYVGAELTPKVRWQDQLRSFFNRRAHSERSYARPSRRMIGQGFIMPSMDGHGMGDVVVAVDLSGSVTEDELQEFITELRAIKQDCRPETTHVIYFASEVTHYESFDQDDDLDLRPKGTGGTAFSPIFRYCVEHDIDPACAVVLTDLHCSDYGPVPAYPVMWVSTGATGPTPFGEVIMLREQRS